MSDYDHHDDPPKPKLNTSEQEDWGVARLRGETMDVQVDRAADLDKQRRDKSVFDDHGQAAEAITRRREAVAQDAAAERCQEQARKVQERAQAAKTEQDHRTIEAVMPQVTEEYTQRLQDFQGRVAALSRIEDPHARQAMEATLEREATELGQMAQHANKGALIQEQRRLHQLRPGLARPETRKALVSWAKQRFGYTDADVARADTKTILAHYDAWQAEHRTAAERRAAAETPDTGPKRHRRVVTRTGIPHEQTASEMHGTLRKSGRLDDALSLIAARRAEREAR